MPGTPRLALALTTAVGTEPISIYSALILHEDEVTFAEDGNNALIKAVSVNIEPSGQACSQRPL